MSGSGFNSNPSNFHGEPPPFSDVIIPPTDYSAYLQPTSSRPNSSTSNTTQRVPTQHDSGVVEDCSFDRNLPVSPRSIQSQPRSPLQYIPEPDMSHKMKRPDSLAVRGHEYEELPTSRQEIGDYSEVNSDNEKLAPRPGPPMMTKLQAPSIHTDSNDNNLLSAGPPLPTYRKRQNPLYDSNDHEEQRDVKVQSSTKTNACGTCPCPCWILLLLALLGGLGGLCLALYNFTYFSQERAFEGVKTAMVISSPNNKTLQDILIRMQKLEEDNYQLVNKVNQLEANIIQLKEREISMLNFMYSINGNLSQQIGDLSTRISNIQLLPGPQGPAGAGNLSQCAHMVKSAGGTSSDPQTDTLYVPASAQEHQMYVIMGIECTTEGGLYANLIVQKDIISPQQYTKYKCSCSGSTAGAQQRYCEIHYWQCPQIS